MPDELVLEAGSEVTIQATLRDAHMNDYLIGRTNLSFSIDGADNHSLNSTELGNATLHSKVLSLLTTCKGTSLLPLACACVQSQTALPWQYVDCMFWSDATH